MENQIPTTVIIPYLRQEAQGKELYYALKGWRRHAQFPIHIIIVGDMPSSECDGLYDQWLKVPQISDDRAPAGEYKPLLDHVNKFKMVRQTRPCEKGFIYTCDDIYAIRDFTLEDVMVQKINREVIRGNKTSENGWIRSAYNTERMLDRMTRTTWDFVCHLPVYFEWRKLLALYEYFEGHRYSLVFEHLYFNIFFNPEAETVHFRGSEANEWRFFSTLPGRTEAELKKIINTFNPIWVSNSVDGYSPELEKIIHTHLF